MRHLDIKVLNIIDARCNHEVYVEDKFSEINFKRSVHLVGLSHIYYDLLL